jgi:hypothetical protein
MLPRRILVAPIEITGQYRNLAIAIRKHGRACDYYTFYSHAFKYGSDLGYNKIPALMRSLHAYGKTRSSCIRCLAILGFELLRLLFFFYAISRYDAFIFGYGMSLLRFNLDLFCLKLLGKRVIANMSHGSDMRPDYLNGALLSEYKSMPPVAKLVRQTKAKMRTIRNFERYASILIGSPLSSSYLAAKPYINIFAIGRVCQAEMMIKSDSQVYSESVERPLRLLHAPSHSPGKGSIEIEKVIFELQRSGLNIDYKRLSGVPNDQILVALQQCDIVIDQLFSDLPMSGVACEAAYLGKPVIVAGYELKLLRNVVPKNWFPPTFICHPDDLGKKIRELVSNPSRIDSRGKELKDFVSGRWKPSMVAKRYLALVDNRPIPNDWYHDPRTSLCRLGYGLGYALVKENIRSVINYYGIGGLCLRHRPDLEEYLSELVA